MNKKSNSPNKSSYKASKKVRRNKLKAEYNKNQIEELL